MSYDLFMRPRAGRVSSERFAGYFAERPNYRLEGGQAWYQNEDTGVYFWFEHSDDGVGNAPDEQRPNLSFNLNFYRPAFFAREAEPEVRAFIGHFDLLVDDPQIGGMGTGEYVPEKLIEGWDKGNEFGYQAVLKDQKPDPLYTLPAAENARIWSWNYSRRGRQAEIGASRFVPLIMLLAVDGAARSAAVWPDALPSLLPRTDYVIVGRDRYAPRQLLWKKKDTLLIEWRHAETVIRAHSKPHESSGFLLSYDSEPPRDVAQWFQQLPADSRKPERRLTADTVLDEELVAAWR